LKPAVLEGLSTPEAKMKNFSKIFVLLILLIVMSLTACNSPTSSTLAPTVDLNAIGTQVAATIEAEILGTVEAQNQQEPEQPSATTQPSPTTEISSTPEPSFTPTLGAPKIKVSVDTNCRTGPGKVYDFVGALVVGQEADVVALPEDSRDYVVIQNPNSPGKCWLWTEYATITGDTSNLPKYEIPVTPTPQPGSISGIVWNDKCSQFDAGNPPPGCVAPANAGDPFPANGKLDSGETGISGILVAIGAGNCPSNGLSTVTTKSDGTFSFGNLTPGNYCISIDVLDSQNSVILIPGGWTYPNANGLQNVTVDSGSNVTGISFGWDSQLD
jgi:hypothetical protein